MNRRERQIVVQEKPGETSVDPGTLSLAQSSVSNAGVLGLLLAATRLVDLELSFLSCGIEEHGERLLHVVLARYLVLLQMMYDLSCRRISVVDRLIAYATHWFSLVPSKVESFKKIMNI